MRVLGTLVVETGTPPVPLHVPGVKERALLGRLLVTPGHTVSVDTLAEDLWAGDPPRTARKSLQAHVVRLRSALEPQRPSGSPGRYVVRRGDGYALALPPDAVDVTVVSAEAAAGRAALASGDAAGARAHFVTALGLWRGEPFADWRDAEWARGERQRLADVRSAVLEGRLDADLALGRHRECVAELEGLVAAEPLREGWWTRLMLALYRSDRQADALAAGRRARSMLADELGVDPGPGLRRLEQAILDQAATLDGAGPPPTLSLQPAPGKLSAEYPSRGLATYEAADADVFRGAPAESATRPAGPPASAPSRPRLLLVAAFAAVAAAVVVASAAVIISRDEPSPLAAGNVVSEFTLDGHLLAQIPVGTDPTAIAAGAGALWTTNRGSDTISRVDPRRPTSQEIPGVGRAPDGLAVAANGLAWVLSPDQGAATPVNTTTERAIDQPASPGQHPSAIAADATGFWVTDALDNTLTRFDAVGRRLKTYPVGVGPAGIAITATGIWVTSTGESAVWRLDPETGRRIGRTSVRVYPTAIAAGATGIWVAHPQADVVTRLDPDGRVVDEIPVGAGTGPTGIAVTPPGVWVALERAGQLARIDPKTDRVIERVPVAGAPRALIAYQEHLWVVSGNSLRGHGGGVLQAEMADVSSLDPASDDAMHIRGVDKILGITGDGLMAYAHVPGAGGLVLVPDLAAEPPAVEGRDYLFRLRSGILYSNGAPLRASDVRSTFERQIRLQGAMSVFATRIDGAQGCSRQHCDLSASIRTDDTAGTVRIRLRRPDPIFTSLVALPEATIVPSSTPARLADAGAIPGTGPYRVAAFTPLRRVELVRNTYFHEWSRVAQPDGYPNSIAVNVVSPKEFRVPDADTTRITNALENGSMDVYPDPYTYRLPPQFMRERALAGRFRVTEAPGLDVADIMLNTHLPPFNNPKARQAVSYAVDRAELIRRQNRRAYAHFTPTCQLIPPGTSGYQPYCPTTANPGATQRWTGPDLPRGQQLVRESGTKGQPVTVWEPSTPFDPDGSYLVDLLNQLGYRARLHTPRPDFDPYVKHVATGTVQASVVDWGNLPRAVDALSYFSCDGFDARRHDYENNLTGFCDHSIDAEYTRAVELSTGERPSDANPLWIDLDRRLTDAAAFVPIWNENFYVLTGRRVGNVISTGFYGVLLDQLWVQ